MWGGDNDAFKLEYTGRVTKTEFSIVLQTIKKILASKCKRM